MNLICDNETSIYFDEKLENIHDITNIKLFNENMNFGIFNLKTNNIDNIDNIDNINKNINSSKKIHHLVFNVDCSGSMSDTCNDNRSKMDHINHTIINMIDYLSNQKDIYVYISIFAFDDKIYSILENELISKLNYQDLISQVKQIRPKNMTNIELALNNSKDYIHKLQSNKTIDHNDENVDITHIFMTDGEANAGNLVAEDLLEIINKMSNLNIFIGFGIDHNAYLLKTLSSKQKNKYYFIDELEKAGYVYGEILHSIIYKIMNNVNIRVKNGLIYDWKNNQWVENIETDDLVMDINKVYHVLSDNTNNCQINISANNYITGDSFQVTIDNKKNYKKHDITKYIFRQRTQELMFEINEHNFNKNIINENFDKMMKKRKILDDYFKNRMRLLLNEMKQYSEQLLILNKNDDYKFMKMLCDDIYITLQTFNTKYAHMFSCSRQVSQGEQRSYSATCTPIARKSKDLDISCNSPRIKRTQNKLIDYDESFELYDDKDNEDDKDDNDDKENNLIKEPEIKNSVFLSNIFQCFDKSNAVQDDDDDDNYEVSQQTDNTYSNSLLLNIMKTCSSSIDDN